MKKSIMNWSLLLQTVFPLLIASIWNYSAFAQIVYDSEIFGEALKNASQTSFDLLEEKYAALEQKSKELNRYGGFVEIPQEISQAADDWIKKSFSAKPKAYKEKISKIASLRDKKHKEGQDVIMSKLERIRQRMRQVYCEGRTLNLISPKELEVIALEYKRTIDSKAWRDPSIGDQGGTYSARGYKSNDKTNITENLCTLQKTINSIYEKVVAAKKAKSNIFLQQNPNIARDFNTEQQIKGLKARTEAAERRAKRAAFEAAAANARANAAAAAAYEAEQKAGDAARRANEAQRRARGW